MKLNGPFWQKTIPILAAGYLKTLYRTQRLWFANDDYAARIAQTGPCIIVIWHNRILQGSVCAIGRNLAVIISRSRDGQLISDTVQRIGLEAVRGSSSRGQLQSVRDLLKLLEQGQSIVMTPDGPRGPCYQMQPGPIEIASLSGAPIVPAGATPKRALRVKSWDRLIVPAPFTKTAVVQGEPIYVPKDIDSGMREEFRLLAERRLCEVTQQSETLMDWPPDEELAKKLAS